VVGRALKKVPRSRRPYVFTKCGLVWDVAHRMTDERRIFTPETVHREVEASLYRLGIDFIDLYQVHWPPTADGYNVQEGWGAMADLVREGKVRAIGVSNFDIPDLEICEAVRHVDSLQPPFSVIHREAGEGLIPWCQDNGTGVIVYSPMQSGLLTDRFSERYLAQLVDEDWRHRSPDFQLPALRANLSLRDSLRLVAADHRVSVGAIAIAWAIAWPGVTGAIVGGRSPEQIDGWIAGGSITLTSTDIDRIAEAIERTGAGAGPIRPYARAA
jgi:aryl-alcohol dehydrogenase-like predicted oxidoreductase